MRSAWPSASPKVLLALEKSASKSKSRDKGKGKEVHTKGTVGGAGNGKAVPWTSDWWESVRSNSALGPASASVSPLRFLQSLLVQSESIADPIHFPIALTDL